MLTDNFKKKKFPKVGWYQLTFVNGKAIPKDSVLGKLRVPPAWTDVKIDPDPKATVLATGTDAAGRSQRLYSPAHVANAKAGKFERIRALLAEHDDILTQIEADINDKKLVGKDREAVIVTYLCFETGVRPGSTASAEGRNSQEGTVTHGATTLQLRHVKPCARGVRLKFVGKKGVSQSVLVTNPWLVKEFKKRKLATTSYTTKLFNVSTSKVNGYISQLGSGGYTVKDLRTAVGTKLALELLGKRKRLPKAKTKIKRIVNLALDQVSRKLGNSRAIAKHSYVDPEILARFLPGE